MKKITILLVIIFSFLFSSTCWGEWTKVVSSGNGDDFYVDREKIKKRGNYVYLWMLIDMIEPNEGGTMSQIRYVKLDCVNKQLIWLKIRTFNVPMAEGVLSNESHKKLWEPIGPKTVYEFIREKSC